MADRRTAVNQTGLDQISTRWSTVHDPDQVVLRYAPAIQAYLKSLLKNQADAEDVAQDFLLHVMKNGLVRARPDRGRFRDYLKRAVRNAALTFLRRKRNTGDQTILQHLAVHSTAESQADRQWLAEWHRCVMEKAWLALEQHQQQVAGNLFFTVLRTAVDHADEDSEALAARVSELAGRPLRADAFRKQLSRARHMFATLLLDEVAQTLDHATPDRIEEELIAVGLMPYVRDFLPPDWRTRGVLRSPE
jgi:RNA polymerase sigma factor (sigma-70 family)